MGKSTPIFLVFFFLLLVYRTAQAELNITSSSNKINTLATYTYTITFPDTTNRTQIYLFFPSQLSLSSSTYAQISGTNLTSIQCVVYTSNNTILVNKTVNGTVVIDVKNVMNPTSSISTYNFTISSNNVSDTTSPNLRNKIDYQPGTMSSCLYSFTGTTEQSNSTLTATIVLGNALTIGSDQIKVSYPIRWQNSVLKSLTYGSSTLTCLYVYNGSTITTNCSFDSTNIYVNINLVSPIQAGSTLQIQIKGINCPPTVVTSTSSSFKVSTYDYAGIIIESLSYCNISDTSISTMAGTFTNSNLYINSVYSNPQINYTSTVPVTFQNGDTLEAYYPVNTTTCYSSLYVSRGSDLTWTNTNNINGVRYYSLSTVSDNSQITTTIQLYLDCAFNTPPSANPATFYFLFKRSGSYYLNLTSIYAALAKPLTSTSNFVISLESAEAVIDSTYTFNLVLSQPLSKQGVVVIILPSVIGMNAFLGLGSCGATINSQTTTLSACNYTTSGNIYLRVYFNYSGVIGSGARIVLSIVKLSNPSYAFTNFPIGINTYYNASLPASLVEYNSSFSYLTYTTYTTLKLQLSPNSFSVYENASTNLTYINSVYLSSGTTLTFVFPSQVTSLTFNSLVYANSSIKTINESNVSSTSPLTLKIVYYYDMPAGTTLIIPFIMKTPSNLGLYGPMNYTAVYNSYIYETSSFLKINVNKTSPINIKISVPSNSSKGQYTGAETALTFSMTSYMPQSTPYFYLIINYPSDTGFSLNGTCSGTCYSTFAIYNSTAINVTVNNSYTFTSNYYNYSFTISTFTNPRHIGSSETWSFISYNKDGSQVGTGTAIFQVLLPSPISAILSTSKNYYRSNTESVILYLTLTNALQSGDYLVLQFNSDTYTNVSSSVSCILTTCSISNQSTTNVLVVRAIPTINQLNKLSLTLQISGLISDSSTIYNQVNYFNISSYNSNGLLIDQGAAAYNVSCGQYPSNNCKQCYSNGSCRFCYVSEGMNLLNGRCVSNCTLETQYFSYNNNGSCISCANGCYTCYNSTSCRSCVSMYYYYQNYSCLLTCMTDNSYFATNISSVLYCLKCYDQTNCASCVNASLNGCSKCSQGVLQQGSCNLLGCTISNTYLASDSTCQTCDGSCNGCSGPGNSKCTVCNYGYYNVSNYCVTSCPTGTAPILSSQTCACQGSCVTCQNISTYCLSCVNKAITNAPQFAYLGTCMSSCPSYSYLSGVICLSCTSGCFNCSATSCYNCDADKFSYNNKCYQDCNSIGVQYDGDSNGTVKKCVLCPNGCDTCSGYVCTSCLGGYSLQQNACVQQCIVLGNCSSPVPEKILPLPGLIILASWTVIVIIVKLLMKKLYTPYSLLLTYCIIEFGVIIASIAVLNNSSSSSSAASASRLLYGMDYSYRNIVKALLAASLAFNYITNFCYLAIFCKYLRPLLPNPHQIDNISNALLLMFATATNYRLGLLAFSKMFPKPQIPIDNTSRLTPVNYLAICTLILDVIPLTAAVFLIYKESVGTNLFMLGIDLVVILAINVAVSIWMVAVPKPEEYYATDIKKTNIQENYKTEQDLKDERNVSMSKLVVTHNQIDKHDTFNDELLTHPIDNTAILAMASNPHNDFTLQSQEENPPLKSIHHNTARKLDRNIKFSESMALQRGEEVQQVINFGQNSLQSNPLQKTNSQPASEPIESKKTKRTNRQSPKVKPQLKQNNKLTESQRHQQEEDNLQRKIKQTAINFSKQKNKKHSLPNKHAESSIIPTKVAKQTIFQQAAQGDMEVVLVKSKNRESPERKSNETPIDLIRSKHKPKRREPQSEAKLFLKKEKVFESNVSDDNESSGNNIDLDSILDSKIKQSKKIPHKLQAKNPKKQDPAEDVSPSWFNIQNQRIDISEIEEIQ